MNQLLAQQLSKQVRRYLVILERLFGPRDPRFDFGSIKRSTHPKGDPQTHFPTEYHERGGCIVDIHISPYPYDNNLKDHATWQLAHECVHLIDPCKGGEANVLEEGLATWFQCEASYHPEDVQSFIEGLAPLPSHYLEAMTLVKHCMPNLAIVLRRVRAMGIRLRDIEADSLQELSRKDRFPISTIERLCARF